MQFAEKQKRELEKRIKQFCKKKLYLTKQNVKYTDKKTQGIIITTFYWKLHFIDSERV